LAEDIIKIIECGEKLVDLSLVCPHLIINLGTDTDGQTRNAYLRETVAKMVCKAKSYLPKGMTFIIGDAWRSKKIQERQINYFQEMFRKKHPDWNESRVIAEASNYIAPAHGTLASGHMTGGAVDLRLWRNGRKMPMKSRKLTYQENALSDQPKLPEYLKKNRKIMFDALTRAGLSNYPLEFWHWSYGDIQWAKRNKKTIAMYGTLEEIA